MNSRVRVTAVALGAAAVTAVCTSAYAVGTGGVELTPLHDGSAVSAFHVHLAPGHHSTQKFLLRNETAKPTQFQLYAAAADRSNTGNFSVEGPGSAPWIGLRTQTVTLSPNETRTMSFDVRRTTSQHGPVVYGAVVVAMTNQQIVSRAAALVYLERPGKDPVSRAVLPLVIAIAVIAVGLLAQAWVRGRRRRLS